MRNKSLQLNKLQIIIFDWDNTLAESRSSLVFSINKVLEGYHMPKWEIVSNIRDHNLSFRDNFPRIFGEKAKEAYEQYKKIYKENVGNIISTFEAVPETLKFFKDRKVLIAVMSNKDRELLEYELPLLFNPEIFDKIVCGWEAPKDKPHPDQALYTLEGLIEKENISEETVWVVGDSPQDSTCAMGVNAQAIRIGDPIWDEEETKCDKIVYFDNFKEFYQHLLDISNPK